MIQDVKLSLPIYEEAMASFISEVMLGFLALDPLLGNIALVTMEHRGSIRNIRGSSPLDQSMSAIRSEASLDIETIRNTDIEKHTKFLFDLAQNNIRGVSIMLFRSMAEITDAAGTSVSAGGRPLSYDLICEMFEKMYFEFDEEGNPIFPTLVLSPEMAKKYKDMKPTPEQEQRLNKIIEQKRSEFNAKKRTRRLS